MTWVVAFLCLLRLVIEQFDREPAPHAFFQRLTGVCSQLHTLSNTILHGQETKTRDTVEKGTEIKKGDKVRTPHHTISANRHQNNT